MKKVGVVIIVLFLVGLLLMFGFFSKYNYVSAKFSISQNEFIKVNINLHPNYTEIEESVGKKYGIRVINLDYRYDNTPVNYCGIKIFNNCMQREYIKKYGMKKFYQYRNELDSLCNRNIAK